MFFFILFCSQFGNTSLGIANFPKVALTNSGFQTFAQALNVKMLFQLIEEEYLA
jgi:hypothetical protein